MENDGIARLTFPALRQCPQVLRQYDKNGRHGPLRSIQTKRQAAVADSQPWLKKVAHGPASRIFKITYRKSVLCLLVVATRARAACQSRMKIERLLQLNSRARTHLALGQ